ncbi:Acetyltransferase including N-acetylase of ribosomal protein-like protein [Halorhabdus utahensis DSM 12940]|uniref:Acetyltransferase including N-acetylase of ribosomal protein-like protein n=1 Tax=Halorhabdus utahensis (strain DSM 12940 / JCM 11049 / AX-2) TaxID=519442 RepID=C7NTG2_HALUD|nr:GNAT family protein [Halorhabdus utahensis]ACV12152.1 Acetyltransferase including N-acetylase of ribosomal protein-like protein [Halorhabdus utahensis DSM 12940]
MLFPEEIETERLRLRRLCHETVDVFEYHTLCSAHEPAIEEVTAYLPWDPHETVKETADYLDELEAKWDNGTRAEYIIRPKEGEAGAGKIVGSGGLIVDWETQTGKPAIWLRKQFWGNGYAGERAEAMLELAFERLDLDLVAIPVQDGNDRSRAAVEKYLSTYGGQYDGLIRNSTVRPDGTIIDHHRYTVTQQQYQEHHSKADSSVSLGSSNRAQREP